MNRRQLNELSSTLTRVDGQRAELKEIADVDLGLSVGNLLRAPEAESFTYRGGPTAATPQPNYARPTAGGVGGSGGEATPPSTQAATFADQPTTRSVVAGSLGFRAVVATQPSAAAKPADYLRLDADPMDHPLDVVIVLQPAPPATPAAVTPAPPAEPAKK
jgi:hypothetical protein